MPSKDTWDKDYVECFKGQPEGWPVYPPIQATKLKPGMCGYFDIDGIWQTIVDLTDEADVRAKNLRAAHGVTVGPGNLADTKKWGLRTSTNVEQFEIGASGKVKYVSVINSICLEGGSTGTQSVLRRRPRQ
jgi:hypothetical protein